MKLTKEQLNNCLKNLALSDNQRKIYLCLFDKQKASVQEISEATHLNRTTIYSIVDELVKRELLRRESSDFGAKIIFSHPSKLLLYAKEKTATVKDTANIIKSLLPELLANYKSTKFETRISQFEGIEGVKKMYNDILVTFTNNPKLKKDSLIGCSNADKVIASLPKRWLNSYRKQKSLLNITGRYLLSNDNNWKKYIQEGYIDQGLKNHPECKNIPKHLLMIDTEISIYANKVSFISLKEAEPLAVIIESKVFSDSLRVIFESLWQLV